MFGGEGPGWCGWELGVLKKDAGLRQSRGTPSVRLVLLSAWLKPSPSVLGFLLVDC